MKITRSANIITQLILQNLYLTPEKFCIVENKKYFYALDAIYQSTNSFFYFFSIRNRHNKSVS